MEQSLHCVRLMNVGFVACIQHMESERELDFAAQKIFFANDVIFRQSIDYVELEKKVAALKKDADRAISLDQKLSCVTQEKERLILERDTWKGKHSSLEEKVASVDLDFGRLRKESAPLINKIRKEEDQHFSSATLIVATATVTVSATATNSPPPPPLTSTRRFVF